MLDAVCNCRTLSDMIPARLDESARYYNMSAELNHNKRYIMRYALPQWGGWAQCRVPAA